ncbi:MAG: two-component system, response regulator PdtaR [bacterium]
MTAATPHLRVLVAYEREDRIALVTELLTELGHVVIARSSEIAEVGELTSITHPDVALVGLGPSSGRALTLIERIVHECECPVIAMLEEGDAAFVNGAAERGVFAYAVDASAEELQGALDIALRRFAGYRNLQRAFARRARMERAKGILMERHQVDERPAFEMMRDHGRVSGQKLIVVAGAVIDAQVLLLPPGAPRHTVIGAAVTTVTTVAKTE